MSYRHRTCHHIVPSVRAAMPPPHQLAQLAAVIGTLVEAASEFDSFDKERWSAVQFIQWLDVSVREASGRVQGGAPVGKAE